MPFWSSRARAERAVQTEAYRGFEPVELTWEEFAERWLPGLESDGLRAGVNWSGPRLTGYDLGPADVRRSVEAAMLGPSDQD